MSARSIAAAAILAFGLLSALVSGTAAAQKSDIDEGDRAFDRGELRRAARAYDRAIAGFPGQVPAEAYGKRAAIYILQKDLAGGLRFVDQVALAQHPGAPVVLEQKALLLWAVGRRKQAVAVAETAVATRPETFTAQQLIGRYYSRSRPEKAVAALTSYFAHRPEELAGDDALPRLRLGFAQLATGDPKAATRQFELVLSRFRGDRIARVNATNGLCAAYAAAARYDRAIATCSRITADRRDIDARASVWYNLARAYLGKRRHDDARRAARRYIKARPRQGKGHLLLGDTFLGERRARQALRHFLDAEKQALSPAERAELGIRLGVTYRRLGRLDLAVAKLEEALARDPNNLELRLELGGALLSAAAAERRPERRQTLDRKAAEVASVGVRGGGAQAVDLQILAGRARYNLGELERAEAHYRAALEMVPRSRKAAVRLTQTINKRAAAAFAGGDRAKAAALSREALEVSPGSPAAHRNLAVLALESGDCAGARRQLEPLAKIKSQALAYHRLSARAALCAGDRAAAGDHFAAAEVQATRPGARDNLTLAAIYTEWAPLLAGESAAVDKLEQAVQFAGRHRALRAAASRNLAVALYRRGWRRLGTDDAGAGADFERAIALGVARGDESLALELSLGLARLSTAPGSAAAIFRGLAGKGRASSYLTARYAGLGASLFAAYAGYRAGGRAELSRAAAEIDRLLPRARGAAAGLLRDLSAAVAIAAAAEHHRAGRTGAARKSLLSARRRRPGAAVERVIAHDLAVLDMGRDPAKARAALAKLGARPPEALVNAGILDDRAGKPRAAFDAWQRARRAGVRARQVAAWIAAKKRMFGW